jgi:hypothetical protein
MSNLLSRGGTLSNAWLGARVDGGRSNLIITFGMNIFGPSGVQLRCGNLIEKIMKIEVHEWRRWTFHKEISVFGCFPCCNV